MLKKSRCLYLVILVLTLIYFSCEETSPDLTIPNAPSNLTADAITAASIKVQWINNSNNEEGFKIEKDLGPNFNNPTVVDILPGKKSYIDKGLPNQTTFYYRLYAYNTIGNSEYTEVVNEKIDNIVSNVEIKVDFKEGSISSPAIVYVSWIENSVKNFIQNLTVCKKIMTPGSLTGTALPFWKVNKYPISDTQEVDAVTSPTSVSKDFSFSENLKDVSQKTFTLYFEVDHSFDENDWFYQDQPAILYAVDIDLNNPVNEYYLTFIGWTPNENTENVIPNTPMGIFQNEKRYITHKKAQGGGFGAIDIKSSTNLVDEIKVTIIR